MTFGLWRQEDNGNRFPASTFAERTSVEQRLAKPAHAPDEQTYWITVTESLDNNWTASPILALS